MRRRSRSSPEVDSPESSSSRSSISPSSTFQSLNFEHSTDAGQPQLPPREHQAGPSSTSTTSGHVRTSYPSRQQQQNQNSTASFNRTQGHSPPFPLYQQRPRLALGYGPQGAQPFRSDQSPYSQAPLPGRPGQLRSLQEPAAQPQIARPEYRPPPQYSQTASRPSNQPPQVPQSARPTFRSPAQLSQLVQPPVPQQNRSQFTRPRYTSGVDASQSRQTSDFLARSRFRTDQRPSLLTQASANIDDMADLGAFPSLNIGTPLRIGPSSQPANTENNTNEESEASDDGNGIHEMGFPEPAISEDRSIAGIWGVYIMSDQDEHLLEKTTKILRVCTYVKILEVERDSPVPYCLFKIDDEHGRKSWPLETMSKFVTMEKIRVSKMVATGDSYPEEKVEEKKPHEENGFMM